MTNTIPDLDQRAEAIRPDRSYIVQAPAGSGKTGLLIQRYLRLLATVDAPEEILAITFTRKAAAEMQGRVLHALARARRGDPAEHAYEQLTLELAAAALKRSEQQGWALQDNPGRLRIQTIDALCNWLVKQMPVVSGLGGQPEIEEDPATLYREAASRTLLELESGEVWSDPIARLLVHLDNDLPRLCDLLTEMLPKRDQWLKHVLSDHAREDLEAALIRLVEENLEQAAALFPADLQDELCRLLHYAANNVEKGALIGCRNLQSIPATAADSLAIWQGIVELLLTKEGGWRVALNKNTGFPPASGNKLEAATRTEMKDAMQALLHRLRDNTALQHALAMLQQLPPVRFTDEEWDVISSLFSLLKLSSAQLQLLFSEQNRMDFNGIARSAVNALGPETEPTDLALHLDYRIRHLLVDEFQDTSVNQLDLLKRLTAGWGSEGGHSLFLVGDPMQSIYRFREAEVANFLRTFHTQRLGQVALEPLVLRANFRSEQGLVDWFNTVFADVFSATDDLTTGAVGFHPSTAVLPTISLRNLHVRPLLDDDHDEAPQLANAIAALKRVAPNDTIAILVRSRNHLVDILPALRDTKISYRAIEIESLATRPAIQDLLALTRAWLQPADRIAWLSVLRAPWCGLELQDLLAIAGTDKIRTIFDACRDDEIVQGLSTESRTRLQRVTGILAEALAQKQRRGVRASVEALWCALGGPACVTGENDLQDATSFFELLESLDAGGDIPDVQRLEEETAGLYAAPDPRAGDDAVQVMTIHKAKGLEFDHVFLPGLGKWSRGQGSDLLRWMLRTRADGGHDLFLGPIRQTGLKSSPVYDYIGVVEASKDRHEQARLLYVAVTRAKKTLHLSGRAKLKVDKKTGEISCSADSRSLLALLWSQVKDRYEALIENHVETVPETESANPQSGIRRLTLDWKRPEPPQVVHRALPVPDAEPEPLRLEYEWAGETIRHVGSVVHRCLQQIAKKGSTGWNTDTIRAERDKFMLLLMQEGVPQTELKDAAEKVQTALHQLLADERGRWILSTDHQQARNEYAISGLYRNKLVNAIIDRTFIDDNGTRWVIDYKTSPHEGPDFEAFLDQQQQRYAGQLQKYATLLQALDNRPIKLGLYFPLLQGWREWDY